MRISESTLLLGGVILALGFTIGYAISLFIDGFHWFRLVVVIIGAGASISLIEKWFGTWRVPGTMMSRQERVRLETLGDISPESLSVGTLQAVLRTGGLAAWQEESGFLAVLIDGYTIYVNPFGQNMILLTLVFGVRPEANPAALESLAERWNEDNIEIGASAHPEEGAFRLDEEIPISDGIRPFELVKRAHDFRAAMDRVTAMDTDKVLT